MTISPEESTPESVPTARRDLRAARAAAKSDVEAPTLENSDGAPGEDADRSVDDAVLDRGTYPRLAEPRSDARLALENDRWHQISPRYLTVQLIANGATFVVIVAAMLVAANVLGWPRAHIPRGILALITVVTTAILPRQVRSIGYQLRDDDLVFRRGILWQRFVAVPYGRMQLVDITHGPLDRGFRIAQLKFVTAAASTAVVIPGLAQATADALRDHLVHVAESRRTGL